jgi:hypothetical protein
MTSPHPVSNRLQTYKTLGYVMARVFDVSLGPCEEASDSFRVFGRQRHSRFLGTTFGDFVALARQS